MEPNDKIPRIKPPQSWILWGIYALSVLIWFKDNIPPLKKIPLPREIALLGMAVIVLSGIVRRVMRGRPRRIPRPVRKSWLIPALLILLAVVVRLPYLLHSFGLMSSDDAVPALMAKHIAEGERPPIYYYGQLYMGSLSEHLQAGFFRIFGYSIFGFKLSILIFFLAFLALQYRFLKEVFSPALARSSLLFYSLPIGFLPSMSLDTTGAFPLVMLLGTLLLYLVFRISTGREYDKIPWVGFLMGLSFWTHQISFGFILTAVIVLIFSFRLRLILYIRTFLFAVLGALPVIMAEIYWGFPLVRFLISGTGGDSVGSPWMRAFRLGGSLLAVSSVPIGLTALGIAGVGAVWLVGGSLRKRRGFGALFGGFFILFLLIYVFSGFNQREAVRYLYPLYFSLPLLFLIPFSHFPRKFRTTAMVAAVLILFAAGSASGFRDGLSQLIRAHDSSTALVSDIKQTGRTYWQADYWTAYLITALSGETVIADSHSINRYLPYRLAFYNIGKHDNYIFHRGAVTPLGSRGENIAELLSSLGIDFRRKDLGNFSLIYDISGGALAPALRADIPAKIPEIDMEGIQPVSGYLILNFEVYESEEPGFFLWTEIPGFSKTFRRLVSGRAVQQFRIPAPDGKVSGLKYWIEFQGLKLPDSFREVEIPSALPAEAGDIAFLSGIGPRVDEGGNETLVMEKAVRIKLERPLIGPEGILLEIDCPIDFHDPYWYGEYEQVLSIRANEEEIGHLPLFPGFNKLELDLSRAFETGGTVFLELDFSYHLPFDLAPLWKTAARLRRIQWLESPSGLSSKGRSANR